MEARLIGLPGSGKSTLLQALGGPEAGEVISVKVPDERLDYLAECFKPRRVVYGEFTLREVPFPKGKIAGRTSELERYVRSMAGSELLVQVLRNFENYSLEAAPDPARDLAQLDSEMILGDLMLVEGVLERKRKQPLDPATYAALEKAKQALEGEQPLRLVEFTDDEKRRLRGFNLTTTVPQLLLVNMPEGEVECPESVKAQAGERPVVAFPFTLAQELSELPPEEQAAFAAELGLSAPAHQLVAQAIFGALGLISFFTVGEDECRAWPIRADSSALEAAGEIHTDLQRGFIRAQVVSFEDFQRAGGTLKACREQGLLRTEGKTYRVQDGDILEIRFSV